MYRLNAGRLIAAAGGKALVIPPQGWRANSFRANGRAMIMALHRVALITQKQQAATVARLLSAAFRKQCETAIGRFLNHIHFLPSGRSAKATTADIFAPGMESILMDALEQVLRETGVKISAEMIPPITSTLTQGYSKTSVLLGQKPARNVETILARRARGLASKITNISATTRKRFQALLNRAVRDELSIADTAKAILKRFPKIQGNRALTIARTEMNNAWHQGSIQAFKESKSLTHVSVIGCESREVELWGKPYYQEFMFRGESTCNIQDVHVADMDQLNFHPNHTGTIIPSRFIE